MNFFVVFFKSNSNENLAAAIFTDPSQPMSDHLIVVWRLLTGRPAFKKNEFSDFLKESSSFTLVEQEKPNFYRFTLH